MKYLTLISLFFLLGCFSNVDKSQTIEEATKLGAPSVETYWKSEDYWTFRVYLSEIPNNAYPRFDSEKSKKLFDRLINSIYQDNFFDSSIPMEEQFESMLKLSKRWTAVLLKYNEAVQEGVDYSSELSHIQGAMLRISNHGMDLIDEFMKSIDREDDTYEVRMEGVEQSKNGLSTQIKGLLLSIKETHFYSKEDRQIMIDYLIKEGPRLLQRMTEKMRDEINLELADMISTEMDPDILESLENLRQEI